MARLNPVSASLNEAILNERLRLSAIIESPEGILRPEVARKLALHSSIDAVSAVELMRSVPVASPYLRAMDLEGPVGIDSLSGATANTPEGKREQRRREIRQNIKPQPKDVV